MEGDPMKTVACVVACGVLALGLGIPMRTEGLEPPPAPVPQADQEFVLISKAELTNLHRENTLLQIDVQIQRENFERARAEVLEITKKMDDMKTLLAAEKARADKAEVRAKARAKAAEDGVSQGQTLITLHDVVPQMLPFSATPAPAPGAAPSNQELNNLRASDKSYREIEVRLWGVLERAEEMLRAENARADKAEARAKAAEALLTPEQKAKLGK